jgi:hypothetical protein
MNCKPGDLAVVVSSPLCPEYLGRIIVVGEVEMLYGCPHWTAVPPIFRDGFEMAFEDSTLCPIRDPGEDAKDESLAYLPPVPTLEVA